MPCRFRQIRAQRKGRGVVPYGQRQESLQAKLSNISVADVRFGSRADICAAKSDVRFALNSDRKSDFPEKAMSALPPKADMCSAATNVCFGPIADIKPLFEEQ